MGAKSNKKIADGVSYVILTIVALAAFFPFVWGLLSSLKTEQQIMAYPPRLFPRPFTLVNYLGILKETRILLFMRNSFVVTIISVLVSLAIAFHSAYALARFKFRGKMALMFGILATAMIPGISIIIPLFLLMTKFGIYDHHLAPILAFAAWQVPIMMWLLKGFIETIPYELEEAAALDGCSRWSVIYRIILPLVRPGMFPAAVMGFVYIWNDFLIPSSLLTTEEQMLAQVGLYRYFADTTGISWGRFTAYTIVVSLPIVIAFLGLSQKFIKGLVQGGLKG
jgi:multiple sugar transport system permease protein